MIFPPIHDDIGYSVISTLNTRLPHEWFLDAEKSTGAAKNDSAAVPLGLWNRRISLLFPHITSASLNVFRRLLMTKLYTSMWLEFKTFLCQKYVDLDGRIAVSIFNRGVVVVLRQTR